MHVKAIVPGAEGMTHPDSRRPPAVPPLCSGGLQATQAGIWTIALQGERTTAQGKNAAVLLKQLIFL